MISFNKTFQNDIKYWGLKIKKKINLELMWKWQYSFGLLGQSLNCKLGTGAISARTIKGKNFNFAHQ